MLNLAGTFPGYDGVRHQRHQVGAQSPAKAVQPAAFVIEPAVPAYLDTGESLVLAM